MIRFFTPLVLAGAALPIAGCGQNATTPEPAQTSTTTTTTTASTVQRETAVPDQPPVQQIPAQAALQSQPGPDGSQVDLLKVAVTGDILTVTARCSSSERINLESMKITDISVIDDATAQRIGVLKDGSGNWLASRPTGNSMMIACEAKPGIFWLKFPAPPATSKTVSINFPAVAPFDGVPVTR